VSGRHIPPDFSRGDPSTLAGYRAVHGRPPAFEAPDGVAYSADILVDETGETDAPWAAFLFFVRWSPGAPALGGHLESDFLVRGATAADVRKTLGDWSLTAVQQTLETLVQQRAH
jgi:hypothetical protein